MLKVRGGRYDYCRLSEALNRHSSSLRFSEDEEEDGQPCQTHDQAQDRQKDNQEEENQKELMSTGLIANTIILVTQLYAGPSI